MKRNKDKPLGKQTSKLEKLRQQVGGLEILETGLEFAENKIQESEEKYQRLFELSPMGIVVLDMKGVITACNTTVCLESGYSKDDFVGKQFSKVSTIRAGDIPKFMKVFASLIRGKVPKPFEVTYTRKDGTTGWAELYISLLKLGKRKIGVQVIQYDITERKQAEEILRTRTHELSERVKELDCLYSISNLPQKLSSCEELFQGIIDLIPPGWQYPEVTCARVILDGQEFRTNNFNKGTIWKQASDIAVNGNRIGMLEVGYLEEKPQIYEGPFLKEERNLINEIAEVLANTIERKRMNEALLKAKNDLEIRVEQRTDELAKANEALQFEIDEHKRVEEVNKVYLAGIENANEGIVFTKMNGEILHFNKAACNIFGYAPTEMEAINISKFSTTSADGKKLEESVREKGKFYGEIHGMRKSGKIFPAILSVSIVKDNEGKLIGRMGVFTDITERKRVEEALRQSEHNFRNSLDSSPMGIMIARTEGEIVYTNQALLDIYGYNNIEEVKETPTKRFFTPESYVKYRKQLKRYRLGKSVSSGYEISIVRTDGEIRHQLVFHNNVIWNGETHFQVLYQDVTERKRIESVLQRSEQFNASLFINSPNPILVINDDASIRYINPALEKITGFKSAGVISMLPPYPWWIKENHGISRKKMINAIRRGKSKYEQLLRTKDGKEFWVEANFETVETAGDSRYHIANWVDLTERKRFEENMKYYVSQITMAQEEERKRISREIHDETIQSLSALALDIDSVQRKSRELPDEFIERIKELRTKTNTILEGLRRFSHELRPGVIDHLGLVPALEILAEELNNQMGIRAHLEVTGHEHRLASETELGLFRIAQEALRNVRKHSNATEAVIKLKFTRKRSKLNITDNGHGFAVPEILGDLVADNKLGLIGMQERARLLNGSFRVKSHVGGGTIIEFEVET